MKASLQHRSIYEVGRRIRPLLWVLGLVLLPARAPAQPTTEWVLVVDGDEEPWPSAAALPADSAGAARIAIETLHARGFFNAVVDSVSLSAGAGAAHARRGMIPLVSTVMVSGAGIPGLESLIARDLTGAPLDAGRLEAAATRVLEAMEALGRPGSSVRLAGLLPDSTGDGLNLVFRVVPGPQVELQGILVQGASRTSNALVERLSGLPVGTRLREFDADGVASRLEETGLFASVLRPVLLPTGDSTAIVQIVLEDAAPGSFDAALGYQPATAGSSGRFVGTGRLALVNPFGGGRRFGVLIDRLPGQVSRAEISASDPFFLSWPVGVEGSFSGLQQDSTFGRQTYRLEAVVRLTRTLALTVSGTREVARPGTAGLRLRDGRQRVPRTDGTFGGVGIRYRSLDRALNPTRGLFLDIRFERGSYTRRSSAVETGGDTTRVSVRTRAERLTSTGRAFIPVRGSWVAVMGGDVSVLVSPVVERSDLFRIGGARSLRGYDEDRFEGSAVGRGVAELRRLIDLRSYAFAFADVGFVDAPEGLGFEAGFAVQPGFGFGLQLDTAAGLVTATYGFNMDDGATNGRIHVAFSFGL